jgi:mannosyltransferase
VTRRQALLLAGLLALGIALRVHGLASHPLWIDEYGTWWAVAGEGFGEVWRRVLAVQGQSPLYYVLVRATVDVLGTSPLSLRLPSLACGLALLALAYPLGRRIFGSAWMALLTVAAFSVNERLIYYTQEARPYGLALLLACTSMLFYLDCLRRGGRRAGAGYLASTAAAFYAHYLFGVVVLVQGVHLGLRVLASRLGRRGSGAAAGLAAPVDEPRNERAAPIGALPTEVDARRWLGRAGILTILFAPGLVQFLGLAGRRHELDWVPPVAEGKSVLAIGASFLDPALLGAIAAAVGVVALLGGGVSRSWRAGSPGLALLWLALPLLALDLLLRIAGLNLLDARYAAAAVPAAALVHALALGLAPERRLLRALPLALFLLAGHLAYEGTFSDRITDHRWEAAMDALRADYRDGDVVLYRTRYVELDAVVLGAATPEVVGFVEWPLLAHWPADRELARRALPYGRTLEVRRKAVEVLEASLAAPRVWLVGHPHVTRVLVRHAERQPGVRVARRERYGQVLLVLLVPASTETGR